MQVYSYPRSLVATRPHAELTREFTRLLSGEAENAADEGKSDEVQSDSMDHDEEYSSESDDVGCDAAVEEQENDTENECTVSYNEDKAAAGTSKLVQPGAISRAPLSNVN